VLTAFFTKAIIGQTIQALSTSEASVKFYEAARHNILEEPSSFSPPSEPEISLV
jgi:hypothetical protein